MMTIVTAFAMAQASESKIEGFMWLLPELRDISASLAGEPELG